MEKPKPRVGWAVECGNEAHLYYDESSAYEAFKIAAVFNDACAVRKVYIFDAAVLDAYDVEQQRITNDAPFAEVGY